MPGGPGAGTSVTVSSVDIVKPLDRGVQGRRSSRPTRRPRTMEHGAASRPPPASSSTPKVQVDAS